MPEDQPSSSGSSSRGFDGLLRPEQAARRLGVSTSEVLRLAHSHKLRHVIVEGACT